MHRESKQALSVDLQPSMEACLRRNSGSAEGFLAVTDNLGLSVSETGALKTRSPNQSD